MNPGVRGGMEVGNLVKPRFSSDSAVRLDSNLTSTNDCFTETLNSDEKIYLLLQNLIDRGFPRSHPSRHPFSVSKHWLSRLIHICVSPLAKTSDHSISLDPKLLLMIFLMISREAGHKDRCVGDDWKSVGWA